MLSLSFYSSAYAKDTKAAPGSAAPAGAVPAAPPIAAPTASTSASPAPESEQEGKALKLTGFRSAQFGDDETAVKAAIVKDFGVADSAIRKSQNLSDRTEVLTVQVPEILKDGGAADVAYVLGYRSKKLMQVNVIWSKETDKELTGERLLANAETLKNYFLGEGYVASTIATNSTVRDGILLFRGADAESHTTALMLHGVTSVNAEKVNTFVPNALLIFYLADPKAPDVFKIPAGKF